MQSSFAYSWKVMFAAALLSTTVVAISPGAENRRDSKCFLYTMDSKGTNVQFVGGAPGYSGSGSPVFSPDGTMIAFDAFPPYFDYQQARIFVYAERGPFKGSFRDLGYGNVPSWSPDSTQIAFMLNWGTPDGEPSGVYIMNTDGTDRRRIAEGWAPHWSPDGEKLAYQNSNGGISVYLFNSKKHIEVISTSDFSDFFAGAAWSPDSEKLAFIGTHNGKRSLVVTRPLRVDREFTIVWSEDPEVGFPRARPAWSPDGKTIIFQVRKSEPSSHYQRVFDNFIYTIAAEDPEQPHLVEGEEHGTMNTSPSYSPDGKRIVFSSQR